jgi:ABC-type sugar transport system permease subunit
MAVNRTKLKPGGVAQSAFLPVAMFAPSVLYIALLVGVPFFLAVLYAFSDARIGST